MIKNETTKIQIPFKSRDDFFKSELDIRLHKRRTLQIKLYAFLDKPSGWKCLLYHIFVFSIILVTLSVSAMEAVQNVPTALHYLEVILVAIFVSEYVLRIWAAGSHSSYQGIKGKLRYVCRLINIIDLVIVIGSIVSLSLEARQGMFTATTLKWLRIIQIMRVIRADRRGSSWSLVSSVIYKHKEELITSVFIGFFLLLVMSYVVFIAENYSKPSEQFKSLGDALYWGMMTVTTIGYGDIAPQTAAGKTILSCLSVITIAFFAMPGGILAAGFALRVEQKQRQKKYDRQKPAAATLIQAMWRYNRTNCSKGYNATWCRYDSLVAEHRKNNMNEKLQKANQEKKPQGLFITKKKNENIIDINTGYYSDHESYTLNEKQQKQIKVLNLLQYQTAIKRFKQLRNPYDVQDVIEQYSQGHFHMMLRIKELNRKMDQNVGTVSKYTNDNNKPAVMDSLEELNSKMNNLESVISALVKALVQSGTINIEPHSLLKRDHFDEGNNADDEIPNSDSAESENNEAHYDKRSE